MDINPETFAETGIGIYDDPDCVSKSRGRHAMTIVGYDEDKRIILNSWGASWGDKGYFYMRFGTNVCGMREFVAYPIVV